MIYAWLQLQYIRSYNIELHYIISDNMFYVILLHYINIVSIVY